MAMVSCPKAPKVRISLSELVGIDVLVIVSVLLRHFRFGNMEGVEGVPETDYSSLFARPKLGSFVRWERR
ncbi:hypothetical protein D6D08_04233 [Aureobasidium pullulans]|nr:hypothetical protein D6D08_04233 [Aureobasidium pullulans]